METKVVLLRTNSKEVRKAMRDHVQNCVYDVNENTYPTFEGAKERLLSEFKRVANHEYNLNKFPNAQDRFGDYLNGIPFHFEYTNSGIENFLNGLGINPGGQMFSNLRSMNLYHYLIFRELK